MLPHAFTTNAEAQDAASLGVKAEIDWSESAFGPQDAHKIHDETRRCVVARRGSMARRARG